MQVPSEAAALFILSAQEVRRKLAQRKLRITQLALGFAAFGYFLLQLFLGVAEGLEKSLLRFKGLGLLLQLSDVAEAVLLGAESGIVFAGNDGGMLAADLEKGLGVRFPVKTGKRVGAAQGKRMGLGQLIPKLLQSDGGVGMAASPQERDHFTESDHATGVAFRRRRSAGKDFAKDAEKQCGIGLAITHEGGERGSSVQSDIAAESSGFCGVQATQMEPLG